MESSCSSKIDSVKSCQKETKSNALAVVPFDDSTLFPHQKLERNFTFVGHSFTIKQNFGSLGVAAVVWDSAIVLGEYLEKNKEVIEGKYVLELGSGTGLTGMVAALLGGEVTVTERQETLQSLNLMVKNNMPKDKKDRIHVRELDWTKSLEEFQEHYDVILGADIIYIKETFDDLQRTLVHLANKDTIVLLSCKIRYDRDTDFLKVLEKDFSLKLVLHEKSRDIRIYSAVKQF
ncbi:hypothetical protein LOTGIDRAFT_141991 [Lottia gigantea]|uniref:Methyltransferase small domain-containing protein n=1 Tax=Lottia gigantea TaxID=225164 RepID=V4APS1_LOTGI|nr:hypothetical protein LOTGIDRAFT_141991 [Lottia gigantea]ESO99207.1 hypothetical protein LOTGIDRAFT_141991 [Lottia gigantea]